MTSSTRIPAATITGVYGRMLMAMSKRMVGEVPDSLGVAWHNPKVLRFALNVGRKSRKWDACDENLKSFAHMAVAALVGCGACLDTGYFTAHNDGLDVAKAREVPRWRESDVFTELERDVMAYAESMTRTPPTVTDEQSAGLLDRLGPAAMLELTATAAMANFMARNNVALGIRSQEFSTSCGLPPLATSSANLH